MDYGQHDIKPTMAAEAALAYEPTTRLVSHSKIEKECLSLEDSKRLVLDMVHRHFHPES